MAKQVKRTPATKAKKVTPRVKRTGWTVEQQLQAGWIGLGLLVIACIWMMLRK